MKHSRKTKPSVTLLSTGDMGGVVGVIQQLTADRAELDWVAVVGRDRDGDLFFYDGGGGIVEDLGTLEYVKAKICRSYEDACES